MRLGEFFRMVGLASPAREDSDVEPRIIIRRGDRFACDNGHAFATAAQDILGNSGLAQVGQFEFEPGQEPPEESGPIQCRICGGKVNSLERFLWPFSLRSGMGDRLTV